MNNAIVIVEEMCGEKSRPYVHALPLANIRDIKSQLGSSGVYCEIDGLQVDCDWKKLIDMVVSPPPNGIIDMRKKK